MSNATVIKKYGNRRLYDTGDSRYITLDELASKIQSGIDVQVIDAKSGEDLTQATLTQIIVEGRGAARMLPVPLLTQLIRLGDDALAEFLGSYLTLAFEMYRQAKDNAHAMAAYNPLATVPFAATNALARMWSNGAFNPNRAAHPPPPTWTYPAPRVDESAPGAPINDAPANPTAPSNPPGNSSHNDVAALRRELEELKSVVLSGSGTPKKAAKPKRKRSRKRSGD
ncbi:MAG: hypothetical protein MJE77_16585 [Proteobacteria bacterium]|nr:hypothetical protein [Pseudomonadota bacterium]